MSYSELAPGEARQRLSSLRLVDVRGLEEFQGPLGHIPGALLVPLSTVVAASEAWPKDEGLLLICRSGRRSQTACELLAQAGFTELYNLSGGMIRWNQEVNAT